MQAIAALGAEPSQDRNEPPVPPGVHIGSKGCRERYTNTECGCPEGRCWVTYARAEHAAGRDALAPRVWLDALDREAREAAPPSGDPELAAAVARLDATERGVQFEAYADNALRAADGSVWGGFVNDAPERTGTLRDVLIALAADVSEEGR